MKYSSYLLVFQGVIWVSEIKYVDDKALAEFLRLLREEISINTKSIVSQYIINTIYPVGSIYMSFEDINPATIFGGNWERIKGKFLLAAGDANISGDIGGNNEVILKQTDIPQFTGTLCAGTGDYGVFRGEVKNDDGSTSNLTTGVFSVKQSTETEKKYANSDTAAKNSYYRTVDFSLGYDSASQTAINILPEYIAVYMWRRMPDDTKTFTLDQSELDDTSVYIL